MRHQRYGIALTAVLIATAVMTGCTARNGSISQFTYPRDFQYLETEQVHTKMAKLARNIQSLNRIFAQGDLTSDQQEAVVAILKEMQTTAAELDPAGRQTNHAMIDQNITTFRRNLALARDAVERTPPNYFLAGSIVGACGACHQTAP